jgi:hypothetical protein
VLGRYRPVRPLGSGGNGSVWLARDEQTGLDVALKIITREGKAAARAEREALAAKRLRHDRCVRAYDVGHDTSHVYITYEYVPGRTLREALRTGALSDQEAIEAAAQVLDALAHAHRAGIVHRDVKPSNVLLEDEEPIAVRLLDFGLAQFDGADTLTAVGDVPGTLAYISPERLAGEEATPESDVWAVGVVLWEALAEKHPFWGVPLQEVAQLIEAGAPPLATERPELPRRLLTAVDTALAPNPAARPRASSLAADLRNALKGPAPRAATSRQPTANTASGILADRLLPVALAALTAAIGATLLPFWPPVLVAAIVLAAGAAAAVRPRLGLAVALAAPVFPFGNEAGSAAIVYGAFAVGWLALSWRQPRTALLFITGPILAPLGALALVPLVVQPVGGWARRAAQGVVAVLLAVLVAAVSSRALPLTEAPGAPVGITPLDTPKEIVLELWQSLAIHPVLLVGALMIGAAAALFPFARRRSRYGIAMLGALLVAGTIATGAGIMGVLIVAVVWVSAAAVGARSGR